MGRTAAAVGFLLAWGLYDHRREASASAGSAGSWRCRETPPALGTPSERALGHADTGG